MGTYIVHESIAWFVDVQLGQLGASDNVRRIVGITNSYAQ